MFDNKPRLKRHFSLLLKVLLILLAAILIGLGITYSYVNRFGSQIFTDEPTFGQILKMGFDRPVAAMGLFGLSNWFTIVPLLLIILGFLRERFRYLSMLGAVLLGAFWVLITWGYWYTAMHR